MGVDRGAGKVIDYQTDPRPFAECLKEFAAAVNNGNVYGARAVAAQELRVPPKNLSNWLDGRKCPYEDSFRRLMTFIAADKGG